MATSEETAGHGGTRLCLSTLATTLVPTASVLWRSACPFPFGPRDMNGSSVKGGRLGACFALALKNIGKALVT